MIHIFEYYSIYQPLQLQYFKNNSKQSMSCQHYQQIIIQHNFISSLTAKIHWICLYDGCTKIKKNVSKEELVTLCSKFTNDHKVMINCENFQIYCTDCQKEIYDFSLQEVETMTKHKKIKKTDPFSIRLLMINNNQTDNILFAGNAEYPPSFQKQKQGLCGLKMNTVSSYLNSIVQLLAAVPIIWEMCSMTDLGKVENGFIKEFMRIVTTIWSGKYRIYNSQELQKQLIIQDSNFKSYKNKTPQNLLYFIVKKIMDQFHYLENPCKSGEIIKTPYQQWKTSKQHRYYTFTKEILGGQCVLQSICKKCNKIQQTSNRFQCLKVSYQKSQYHSHNMQIDLFDLIQESFNWRKNHFQIIKKIQENKLQCQGCSGSIKEYYAFVRLPNHLIIEFGDDIEGLNTTLPDQIDLTPFDQDNIKKKSQNKVGYQYLGSIYRKQKRFITHIKHAVTKKQYNICDQIINEGDRICEQTKIAIYKRISNPKNQPLYRNIISCVEVNVNPIVPLPDYWILYLKYNFTVQPLLNPFICTHGKIKDNLHSSKMQNIYKIPIEIYQYLLQIFGGRSLAINPQQKCEECQAIQVKIKEIKISEKEMASFADKLSHKKQRVLISRTWLQSWKQYIYQNNKKSYRIFGNLRPGPIKNQAENIQQSIADGSLKKISPQVWYFLNKFYGGGPLISKSQIHPNVVLTASVNLRYQNMQPLLANLYGQKYTELSPIKTEYQRNAVSELEQQHSFQFQQSKK